MPTAHPVFKHCANHTAAVTATHVGLASPRRAEAESFIRALFFEHHSALIRHFAPQLMLLEQQGRIVAATGWRGADAEPLFLERYLDTPIEQALGKQFGQTLDRRRIVEVGNLASEKPGGSLQVIANLAGHLDRQGYEWVVFTATQKLISIFTRLGLPLLALAKADPSRVGDEISDWGSYYDTQPIVVAGRIRLAFERIGCGA